MYEKKIPENFECGISVALKVLGGKWNALIIEYIHLNVRRPSELHRAMEQANPRVINMALKELEDYGIVRKKMYNEVPLRTEYYLTPLGETLLPVLYVLEDWGHRHREEVVPDFSMPEKVMCNGVVKYSKEAPKEA